MRCAAENVFEGLTAPLFFVFEEKFYKKNKKNFKKSIDKIDDVVYTIIER